MNYEPNQVFCVDVLEHANWSHNGLKRCAYGADTVSFSNERCPCYPVYIGHFPVKPPADIPFLYSLPLLLCCCARSLPNHHRLSAGESIIVHALLSLALHCTCKQCHTHRKYACNNCIPVAVYSHTYTQMRSLHATRLVTMLSAWQLPK